MPVPPLSSDIAFLIFCHLDVESISNVRLACREFRDLTNLRSYWQTLYEKHITRFNLPIPSRRGQPVEETSTRNLQALFYKATRLRRNWISPTPVIRRRCTFLARANSRVIALHFLPCQSWRWLISLSLNTSDRSRQFLLQTWDLMAFPPVCIGTKELRHFGGMAVNEASTEHAVIVLNPTIEVLSPTLATIAAFHDEPGGIVYYSGSRMITRSTDARLYLDDLEEPDFKVELVNPDLVQNLQTRDIIFIEDFALVIRMKTLELYALPAESESPGESKIEPIAKFEWAWKVDNAKMSVQVQHPSRAAREFSGPVRILLRFGSLFPWSINVLHHYELHPDPSYDASEPPSAINLPYKFPPVLRETIGSPVRLHATSTMAMGPYGTAIWTDSHTQDYFDHSDRGQRVAGKFTPARQPFTGQDEDEDTDLSDQLATAMATSMYAFQEEDSWVSMALDEAEGKIALGHDQGQITILEYV